MKSGLSGLAATTSQSVGGCMRRDDTANAPTDGGRVTLKRAIMILANMKLAIIGYGNVGRALARLLRDKHKEFPFTITGIHTLRHGTATDSAGLAEKVTEAMKQLIGY